FVIYVYSQQPARIFCTVIHERWKRRNAKAQDFFTVLRLWLIMKISAGGSGNLFCCNTCFFNKILKKVFV
ncbi:MAG: hypothetical protein IJV18_06010, partial [Acidaminococcaceae bacterium]|nr:hypothetical protein [Acidaminococcaceae bacterium]